MLIAARAVQGLGAALLLTEYAGCEWVLVVNVSVGIGAALLAPRLLPESRTDGLRRFDVAGAVTVTAGLSLLVYTLVEANDAGGTSAQTVGLRAAALALPATFVVIELRSAAPLVSFSIFRTRTLTATNAVAVVVAAALFAMFFFVSLYMQQVLGYDALKAGLAYLPLADGIIVSAGMASQLVTRVGFKPVFVTGLVLTAAGLIWFSQVSVDGSYVWDSLFPSLLSAVGLGFAFVSMTIAAVAGVGPREAGSASGLINMSQQVGGALGLAILASVATSRTESVMADAGGAPSALKEAITEGFQSAFAVGAGFAVVAAILPAVLISSRASRAHAEAARAGTLDPAAAMV